MMLEDTYICRSVKMNQVFQIKKNLPVPKGISGLLIFFKSTGTSLFTGCTFFLLTFE
jgi:hypothetical protein